MLTDDINKFLDETWYQPRGLLIATVFIVITVLPINLFSQLDFIFLLLIAVLLIIGTATAWHISRTPRKVKRNRVGFIVAIHCSEKEEHLKLKEDFIFPLKSLLDSGDIGKTIDFISLPQHISSSITSSDDAERIRLRCRAHFMIYGRVRLRKIDGQYFHMMEIQGVVTHTPTSVETAKSFSAEFAELLPRQINVAVENDVLLFQLTSDWAGIVSTYIIALAAAISNDYEYAEKLLLDAQNKLERQSHSLEIFQKLKARIPARLAEIYEVMALICHRKWVGKYDNEGIHLLELILNKVPQKYQSRILVQSLRATCTFWIYRNTQDAIDIINRLIRNHTAPATWLFSLGFLYGYLGDLRKSIRYYRISSSMHVVEDTTYQVEEFICKIIELEPSKFQLYYCLGFFNKEIKGDLISAKGYFNKFIEYCPEEDFKKEVEMTRKWLLEVENKLATDFN
jgi:tetratricopeptide (TPR) repeat protein